MNYLYYVDILDRSLCKKKKNDKASILRPNLFDALISSDMIVLVRLLSLLQISKCMKIRWLVGKTHELKEYGWGPISMGRVIDTWEAKMKIIRKNPEKVLDKHYMMIMF
jgi:hypothetical protein